MTSENGKLGVADHMAATALAALYSVCCSAHDDPWAPGLPDELERKAGLARWALDNAGRTGAPDSELLALLEEGSPGARRAMAARAAQRAEIERLGVRFDDALTAGDPGEVRVAFRDLLAADPQFRAVVERQLRT